MSDLTRAAELAQDALEELAREPPNLYAVRRALEAAALRVKREQERPERERRAAERVIDPSPCTDEPVALPPWEQA